MDPRTAALERIDLLLRAYVPTGTTDWDIARQAYEALRAGSASTSEPIAHVPVHPKNGPLWMDTYPHGTDVSQSRPSSYPTMALYGGAPASPSLREDATYAAGYQSGVKDGWNFAIAEDQAGYQRAMSSSEHVAVLKAGGAAEPVAWKFERFGLPDETAYEREWHTVYSGFEPRPSDQNVRNVEALYLSPDSRIGELEALLRRCADELRSRESFDLAFEIDKALSKKEQGS